MVQIATPWLEVEYRHVWKTRCGRVVSQRQGILYRGNLRPVVLLLAMELVTMKGIVLGPVTDPVAHFLRHSPLTLLLINAS